MVWKLVPVEPTSDMVTAKQRARSDEWYAMIAAAPKASADEALVSKIWEIIERDAMSGGWRWNTARAIIKMLEGER